MTSSGDSRGITLVLSEHQDFQKSFQTGECPLPAAVRDIERPRISNWASHKGLDNKYPWGIALENTKRVDWFFEDEQLIEGNVSVEKS